MIIPNGNGGMTILPNPQNNHPSECPKCHKEEHIIETCKHCGYVYPEPEGTSGWVAIPIILLGIWVFMTLLFWLMNLGIEQEPTTLLETLKSQWEFVIKAFKHIV